jgi:hypothetical protein
MKFLLIFLQVGELFDGKFNWRGLFHLGFFIFLGLIVVSFSIWIGYKAFSSGKNDKR